MVLKRNIESIVIGTIILMKNKIIKKNLPSFCTSNFDVIKAILFYSKYLNLPVLLECTSNQVNQNRGYSGLKPKDFRKKVISLSKKIKLNKKKIIFGADHLGPLPWKDLDKKKAFRNAKNLLKSVLNEDFEKIHLDTTIICKNDKKFSIDVIQNRFFKLFELIPKKKLRKLYLVVGSEVPFAGGGNLTDNISNLKDIQKDFSTYNNIINKGRTKSVNFALVIEPGMSFSNSRVRKPDFEKLTEISNFSKKNNLHFEAHSTDYQKEEVLKKLVKLNFKFLKVGPELTFKLHESIKYMLRIEKTFVPFKNRSNLDKTLLAEMKKYPKYWKSYYKGNKNKINFLKFNSLLDRARYYWNFNKIINSKNKLYKNIDMIPKNKILDKLKVGKKMLDYCNKYRIKNSEIIIIKFLQQTVVKYYKACGFRFNIK